MADHSAPLEAALADLRVRMRDAPNFVACVRAIRDVVRRHQLEPEATLQAFRREAELALQAKADGVSISDAMRACVWTAIEAARWMR